VPQVWTTRLYRPGLPNRIVPPEYSSGCNRTDAESKPRNLRFGKRINPVRSSVQGERKAVFKAIIESTLAPNPTATSLKVKEVSSIQTQWKEFKKDIFCKLFAISGFINSIVQANIIVDLGCLSYTLYNSRFTRQNSLERILVSPLGLEGFDRSKDRVATKVAILDIDLNGYLERIFAYITPLSSHDIFLGLL
jgi:hypothetical protein